MHNLSTIRKMSIHSPAKVGTSHNQLFFEFIKFIKRNESNYSLRDSVNKLVDPFPRTNY